LRSPPCSAPSRPADSPVRSRPARPLSRLGLGAPFGAAGLGPAPRGRPGRPPRRSVLPAGAPVPRDRRSRLGRGLRRAAAGAPLLRPCSRSCSPSCSPSGSRSVPSRSASGSPTGLRPRLRVAGPGAVGAWVRGLAGSRVGPPRGFFPPPPALLPRSRPCCNLAATGWFPRPLCSSAVDAGARRSWRPPLPRPRRSSRRPGAGGPRPVDLARTLRSSVRRARGLLPAAGLAAGPPRLAGSGRVGAPQRFPYVARPLPELPGSRPRRPGGTALRARFRLGFRWLPCPRVRAPCGRALVPRPLLARRPHATACSAPRRGARRVPSAARPAPCSRPARPPRLASVPAQPSWGQGARAQLRNSARASPARCRRAPPPPAPGWRGWGLAAPTLPRFGGLRLAPFRRRSGRCRRWRCLRPPGALAPAPVLGLGRLLCRGPRAPCWSFSPVCCVVGRHGPLPRPVLPPRRLPFGWAAAAVGAPLAVVGGRCPPAAAGALVPRAAPLAPVALTGSRSCASRAGAPRRSRSRRPGLPQSRSARSSLAALSSWVVVQRLAALSRASPDEAWPSVAALPGAAGLHGRRCPPVSRCLASPRPLLATRWRAAPFPPRSR